jgi:hypothetical protein
MASDSGVAAGARRSAENTIIAPTSHEIRPGPPFFARAGLLFHNMPQIFIAAVPHFPDYLSKTPENLR